MIIYCTEELENCNSRSEKDLLHEMGIADWVLTCVIRINDGLGAKYYFYKDIPNY